MSEPIVIDAEQPFGNIFEVYLNGELQRRCFEVVVTTDAFFRPTTGEAVISSDSTLFRDPEEDEFERDGLWCRRVIGEISLRVSEQYRGEFLERCEHLGIEL